MPLYPDFLDIENIALSEILVKSGHYMENNFDLVMETNTSYDGVDVSMYKSSRTGLRVFVGGMDVPIVPSLHPLPLT